MLRPGSPGYVDRALLPGACWAGAWPAAHGAPRRRRPDAGDRLRSLPRDGAWHEDSRPAGPTRRRHVPTLGVVRRTGRRSPIGLRAPALVPPVLTRDAAR